jgi:cytochrome c553
MNRTGATDVAAGPASSTGRYGGRAWALCFAIGLLAMASLPAAHADDVPDIAADLEQCAGCHGADGKATSMPTAGRIAGQNREYLRYILRQYRAGRLQGLNAGVMTNAVRHLDDGQLDALAGYYSRLE